MLGCAHLPSHMGLRTRAAMLLALAGGLLHILFTLSILFLPIFQTCKSQFGGQEVCQGYSYLDLGGNALGYGFLVLMFLGGVIVIATNRYHNRLRVLLIRWLVLLASLLVMIIAGWGFGFYFAPGALLLLLAAILS